MTIGERIAEKVYDYMQAGCYDPNVQKANLAALIDQEVAKENADTARLDFCLNNEDGVRILQQIIGGDMRLRSRKQIDAARGAEKEVEPIKCVKCGLTFKEDSHKFGFRDHAFVTKDGRRLT